MKQMSAVIGEIYYCQTGKSASFYVNNNNCLCILGDQYDQAVGYAKQYNVTLHEFLSICLNRQGEEPMGIFLGDVEKKFTYLSIGATAAIAKFLTSESHTTIENVTIVVTDVESISTTFTSEKAYVIETTKEGNLSFGTLFEDLKAITQRRASPLMQTFVQCNPVDFVDVPSSTDNPHTIEVSSKEFIAQFDIML